MQSLAAWVGERFAGLEMIDAATSASLTSALDQLREVAGLMTLPLPPTLAAVDVGVGAGGAAAGMGASLQQLGASAAALGAGLRGLAAAGGEAAALAPEELVASLTAALAQVRVRVRVRVCKVCGFAGPRLLGCEGCVSGPAAAAGNTLDPPQPHTNIHFTAKQLLTVVGNAARARRPRPTALVATRWARCRWWRHSA